MKTRRRKLAALLTGLLLLLLAGGAGLWVRSAQRPYALNRRLISALVHGNDKQALALVEAGADPNARYKPTPAPSFPELVKQLFHRSPPSVTTTPTALLIACGAAWHNEDAADEVYRIGLNKNERIADGVNQICLNNNVQIVRAMLIHGADLNARADYGWTPLMWSMFSNRQKAVTLLLEHGASVDAQEEDGMTALMYAAIPDNHIPDLVACLLEHGADANIQDKNGDSALYWAVVYGGDKAVVLDLLRHGANPNLADKEGVTPLMLAEHPNPIWQRRKRPDIVALLKQYGAKK